MAWQFAVGNILGAADLDAVTLPWNAKCQVRMSTPQSLTNNTNTALLFDTEDFDARVWHSTASLTERIVPTIQGWYRVTFSTDFQSDTDYTRATINVAKNGASTAPIRSIDMSPVLAVAATPNVSGSVPLITMNGTTDYLSLIATQINTSTGANTCDAIFLVELALPF